jgi:hypothetical protein
MQPASFTHKSISFQLQNKRTLKQQSKYICEKFHYINKQYCYNKNVDIKISVHDTFSEITFIRYVQGRNIGNSKQCLV